MIKASRDDQYEEKSQGKKSTMRFITFKMTREDVKVHVGVKQELERAGIQFKRPNKDIVVIEQNTKDSI